MRSEPPSGWTVQSVGDLTINLDRHRVPLSSAQRSSRCGPYPYWGANGAIDSIDAYLFEGPHVLVAEDGTVVRPDGRATVHWADGRFWVNNHAHVLKAAPGVDQRWLFFALSQVDIRAYVTGSVQPKLNQRNFNSIRLPTPSKREQVRIGSVLGALDDKIDSNRRLAALLQETAATLFRGWFVNFVGMKAVDQSEVGPAPPGWRVVALNELATVVGHTVRPGDTPDACFEHFSIPAYDNGRQPFFVPGSAMLSAKVALPGTECVLISKLNPASKRVWWFRPTTQGRAVCSPEFVALVAVPTAPTTYLYGVLSSDDRFYGQLLSRVTGTTGSRQRVKPSDILTCPVLVPNAEALDEWDQVARPLYDHAHALNSEAWSLDALRDALLSKLVSGELRVPDTADPGEVIEPVAEELLAAS